MTAPTDLSDSAPAALLCGVLIGLIIAVGPGTCHGDSSWCDGYAKGSGKQCVTGSGSCSCADSIDNAREAP